MSPDNDPLELAATTRRVRAVARAVPFDGHALQRGLTLATESPDAREWRDFLSRTLLVLAAALALSGVVCFIAYNWARIGRFGKFALIELAIVAAAAIAWRKLPKLSGEIALLAAAVLVGPLLALFGQTYQTGADPYGLFTTWLLIILPWVVASRLSAVWVLALLIGETALVLYWSQVIGARDTRDLLWLPLTIAALHGVALLAWEWQRTFAAPWLTERWAQRFVAVFGVYALWLVATIFILSGERAGPAGLVGILTFAAAVGGMLRYYGRPRSDRFMLTIAVVAAMALGTVAVGRLLFDMMRVGFPGMFLMAALVVWQITVGLKWYRRMRDAT